MLLNRAMASTNWRVRDPVTRPRQEKPPQENECREGKPKANESGVVREAGAATRIYVGNLLYAAQPGDVERLFRERGQTMWVMVRSGIEGMTVAHSKKIRHLHVD